MRWTEKFCCCYNSKILCSPTIVFTCCLLVHLLLNRVQDICTGVKSRQVQEYKSTVVREYRIPGEKETRSTGIQKYRSTGPEPPQAHTSAVNGPHRGAIRLSQGIPAPACPQESRGGKSRIWTDLVKLV